MDPVQKMWMYQNWIADTVDEVELYKNQAYLTASFSNPEGVKSVLDRENNSISTTEDEFEDAWGIVKDFGKQKQGKEEPKKRRRRR